MRKLEILGCSQMVIKTFNELTWLMIFAFQHIHNIFFGGWDRFSYFLSKSVKCNGMEVGWSRAFYRCSSLHIPSHSMCCSSPECTFHFLLRIKTLFSQKISADPGIFEVRMSVIIETCFVDLTDVTLTDAATNSILTDDVDRGGNPRHFGNTSGASWWPILATWRNSKWWLNFW